jgi:hypothetical protein
MKKITIVKCEFSSFAKYKDTVCGDIRSIKLLHVNDFSLSSKLNSWWYNDYNRGTFINFDGNEELNDNLKWSSIEIERMNNRLRQELNDSSLIICEDELTKYFLTALVDFTERDYTIIVNKDEQFPVGTLFNN